MCWCIVKVHISNAATSRKGQLMRTLVATRRTFARSIVIAVLVALCAVFGTATHRLAYAGEAQAQASASSDATLFPMGNDRLWAGESLHLSNAQIPNDLLTAGRAMDIRDTQASGSIRAAGQAIGLANVTAQQSITVAGDSLQITDSQANAIAMAGRSASFSGTCNELSVFATDVFIDGTVNGDVTVGGKNITLGSNAKIAGTLHVSSTNEPTLQEGAAVTTIDYVETEDDNVTQEQANMVASSIFGGLSIVFTIIGLISTIIIALLAEWLFARHTAGAAKMISERTTATVATGMLGTIAAPAAAIFLCLLVVTIPVAGCIALTLVAMGIVCGGFTGASLFRLAFPKLGRYACALAGGAIVSVVQALPIVGHFARLVTFAYLLGYVLQSIYLGLQENKRPSSGVPTLD